MTAARSSFEHTATGILGDHRLSMLKNELHFRVKKRNVSRIGLANCLIFQCGHWATLISSSCQAIFSVSVANHVMLV